MEASSLKAPPGFAGFESRGVEEHRYDDGQEDVWVDSPLIPDLFTSMPLLADAFGTATSQAQNDTAVDVLALLCGSCIRPARRNRHGIPHLERYRHARFLRKSLGPLTAASTAADASRPWSFYWALCGLAVLGQDVAPYRAALISTVRPMQNPSGGFGGGHMQTSHLASTYAVVCALATVGGPDALELIDRRAMWRWLGTLKQPDGGFRVTVDGEEDVRYECLPCRVALLTR